MDRVISNYRKVVVTAMTESMDTVIVKIHDPGMQ